METPSSPIPPSEVIAPMNSIKCKNCGLNNFASETECGRCGYSFVRSASEKKRDKTPRSFSLMTPLMIALAAGAVYYFYTGVQSSVDEVNANEAKRAASQPAERPATPGLSRTQYDQQRSGHYGNAVANSASLQAHQKHIDETQKIMQQVSNSK